MLRKLKGADREEMIEQIKGHLGQIEKDEFRRQIATVEGFIFDLERST